MRITYLFAVVYFIMPSSEPSNLCQNELNHKNCNLLPSDNRCGRVKLSPRIVGGHDTSLGDFPWMALLHQYDYVLTFILFTLEHPGVNSPVFYLDEFTCGGAVITERYVVSAAHCFSTGVLNTVRLGEYNVSSDFDCFMDGSCAPLPQDLEIESVTFPPDSDQNRTSDIALVRIKQKIEFNDYVSPICLPIAKQFMNEEFIQSKTLEVVGWGLDVRKDKLGVYYHDVLQALRLPYVSRAECTRISEFLEPLDEGKLCAGGVQHKDSCRGDSGGPLSGQFMVEGPLRNFLLGIVSFGRVNCYQGVVPGVYANVPFYINWILDNLLI